MKKFLLNCFLFSAIFCFAQQERSEKFLLSAGVEYKLLPYNFRKSTEGFYWASQLAMYNRDTQLKGFSINIGLEWFFLKNTTVGIVQSFRYNPVFYQSSFSDEHGTTKKPVHSLILDTDIQVKHYFHLKDKEQIFVNVGYGIMNQNTDYSSTYNSPDSPNGGNFIADGSFKFAAYKIGFGYTYKNLEIGIGTYIGNNSVVYSDLGSGKFGIPYFKLSYNLARF
ncbi:MAG: hypothetical protein QM564_01445 [Bergeyella sp.]